MQHIQFDTRGEHPNDRATRWNEINREYFGDLEVECLNDEPLDAEFSVFTVGSLRMFLINGPAHRIQRGARCNEPAAADDMYKLVLQLQGHADILQRDSSAHLRRGDWSLYDPHVPYSITNHERTSLLVVQIPRPLLKGFKVPGLHNCQAHASSVIGLHAVLGSFLQSLSEQLVTLSDGVGQPLSETVVGLLASTLAAYHEDGAGHATLPGVLKARVKQYVQAHLGEPDLTIERIAQDMRCSKRYLHRVFEDEACSLDRYSWKARLDRCQAALQSPGALGKSVSEVAYTWGFNSSAHFCRLFKNQYGLSPTEFRRQSLKSAESMVAPASAASRP